MDCQRESADVSNDAPGTERSETMAHAIDHIQEQIVPLLREHGVVRAAVFGSYARGTAMPSSDLDLVVQFEAGRTLLDLVALQQDLRESLEREVDVVTYDSLHPRLRESVLREQVPVL